VWRKGREVSAG